MYQSCAPAVACGWTCETDTMTARRTLDHRFSKLLVTVVFLVGISSLAAGSTAYYDPTSDDNSAWSCTGCGGSPQYTVLDDGVREPTIPNTGDYIFADKKGDISESNYLSVTEANVKNITAWVYTQTQTNSQYSFELLQGGTSRCLTSVGESTPAGWQTCTWAAPSGDFSDLSTRYNSCDPITGGQPNECRISAVYLDVTYDTPPVVSYLTPTPADAGYIGKDFAVINASVTDDFGVSSCTNQFDGTNYSMTVTKQGSDAFCIDNRTGLTESQHTFRVFGTDTDGQTRAAATRSFTVDLTAPSVTPNAPTNDSQDLDRTVTFNATFQDNLSPPASSCSLNLDGTVNQTVSNVADNGFVTYTVTGIEEGTHRWNVSCTDQAGNTGTSTTYWFEADYRPDLGGVSASPDPIKGGNVINVSASGVGDPNGGTLEYVCSEATTEPTPANSICTGGNTVGSNTSTFSCTYATDQDTTTHTTNCRLVDQDGYYSPTRNDTYDTDSTPPSLSISSIAGDSAAPYYDNVDDSLTSIVVNGEQNMQCRWSSSDIGYNTMTNGCTNSSSSATCDISDVASQGGKVRYIACEDELGNAQTASENLQASFVLDYTKPTTFDNATTGIKVPPYIVNITEQDNVDQDPETQYCIDQSNNCIPDITIDDGGTVLFDETLRGTNYFRFASTDSADNTQSENTTIDINELPTFSAASDDATTIGSGKDITITTTASDPDQPDGQDVTLRVCDAAGADANGCTTGTQLCTATEPSDPSCTFQSQSTSGDYQWYAYIYDSLDEAAPSNPRNGSYTVDADPPTITSNDPENTTYGQSDVPSEITLSEAGQNVAYELIKGPNATGTNVSMNEIDSTTFAKTLRNLDNGDHGIRFWAEDSYDNTARSQAVYFTVDDTLSDATPPTLTISSPTNNSFHDSTVFLNVSTDEEVTSMNYSLDGGTNTSMGNTTFRDWNQTLTPPSQGEFNITFWASDRASNVGRSPINRFTYDTDQPTYSNVSFSPSSPSDADDVTCSIDWTDNVELDTAVIGHNATGSFTNQTYQLSGTAGSASRTIPASKLVPGGVQCRFWGFDTTGNGNAATTQFSVSDGTPPTVENLTYAPSDAESLDPGTQVTVEVDVTDTGVLDTSSVTLQYDDRSGTAANLSMTSIGGNTYQVNHTFSTEANWTVRAWADDTAGNTGTSVAENVSVFYENRFSTTDTLPTTKARVVNEDPVMVFGNITLNNTGDQDIDIEVTSDLSAVRFAGVTDQSITRNVGLGATSTFNVTANTTGFSTGQYPFTITMNATRNGKEVEVLTIDSEIVIQNVAGPLMRIEFEEFSSNVNSGQDRVRYKATAENIGTEAADEGWLSWALPSQFSLRSGLLNVTESPMVIGGSLTNNIRIDVNNVNDQNVTITSRANATDGFGDLEDRVVTIGQPETIVQETDGGGNGVAIIDRPPSTGTERQILEGQRTLNASTRVDLVRGQNSSFPVRVRNIFENTTLHNASLAISGFQRDRLSIRPAELDPVEYQETGTFTVNITSPAYMQPGRYELSATVRGDLTGPYIDQELRDRRDITLVIHTISRDQANQTIQQASTALASMSEEGFQTGGLRERVREAEQALRNREYDEAASLVDEIDQIREWARQSRQTMETVRQRIQAEQTETGQYLGYTQSFPQTEELLRLAQAAAEREDYETAYERAQQAEIVFQSESQQFSPLFFLFRYWQEIVGGIVLASIAGFLGYRQYRIRTITGRIRSLDAQEDHILESMKELQERYYQDEAIGKHTFDDEMEDHEDRLAEIRQQRTTYRNKRIGLLSPGSALEDLKKEREEVIENLNDLQEQYYGDGEIGKRRFERQSDVYRERLAEIEEEQVEIEIQEVVEE